MPSIGAELAHGPPRGCNLCHILLSSALTERLQGPGVDRQTRGVSLTYFLIGL